MRKLILIGAALVLPGSAMAQTMCTTDTDNCSGIWTVENTTAEPRCFVIFWGGGNGTKNFCLAPGESATEQVRSGDSYCVEQNFTPPVNSCNRQAMAAY